jgi:anti-anti-sigma factor
MTDLLINESSIGSYAVLLVTGDLGFNNSGMLKEKINELIEQGKHRIAVDLSRVSMLSSIGLSVMLNAFSITSSREGDFRIICPKGHIREVFSIACVDDRIPIHDSLDDLNDEIDRA